MLTFVAAVFFLFITPGPGVLSLAGVGGSYGFRPAMSYFAGLFVGTNMVALAVISGLAAVLELYPTFRFVLFILSGCYLLYLAAKIAFAGSEIGFIHPEKAPGFWGGIALQAVNPKAYVVNTAMFSGFPFLPENPGAEILIKLVIVNVIWISIHFLWLGAGVGLNRLDLSQRTRFRVNLAMALSMLMVVALAASAEF